MFKRLLRRSKPAKVKVVTGKEGGLTTFGGVFTPSILTVLGVIMYLRFGWVVGNVGLLGTLLIVTLSTSITLLTAFSIAAIATDQRVQIGGAYYMISRSLGVEIGGAVGIPLFLAQGLSVALYTVGFAESIVGVFPSLDIKIVGVITTVLVAVLALTSAQLAIRAQYFIMTAIALSVLSLLFGKPIEASDVALWGAPETVTPVPFWSVFAVFFPAVTGIMAGVNLSGDLANPEESIPRGTFAAVGTGYAIYMVLPVVLAMRAGAETLIEDPLVMRRIAFWGDAILLGVWGATLSSAIGSILGAPRVLQALALDGVLPRSLRWLGKGSGEENTPRAGTVLTLVLSLGAVWIGDLNLIAPVLSMFFLTTYAVLNISAGIEQLLNSPSFRPTFRVHWAFSLLGAAGCIAVMLLINAWATAVAAVLVVAIFAWLERRSLQTAWGDVRQGLWMSITRLGLMRMREAPDPKNWRPHLLVLSGAPTKRWYLIELATAWTHNRALMTLATVMTDPAATPERRLALEAHIRDYLARRGVQSLVRTVSAANAFEGAEKLVETYGIGPLVPNTVVLGDTQEPESEHVERFCEMIANIHRARRNVVVVRPDEVRQFGNKKRIDVWWGGLKGNGGLMKILAYLLQSGLDWSNAEVRVKIVVPSETAVPDARANLTSVLDRTRTGAVLDVIVGDGAPFDEILQASSADADVVFLGMATPAENFADYYRALRKRTDGLPTTVFVLAAEEIGFEEVLA